MENITSVYKGFSNLYPLVNVHHIIINYTVPAGDLLIKSVLYVGRKKGSEGRKGRKKRKEGREGVAESYGPDG